MLARLIAVMSILAFAMPAAPASPRMLTMTLCNGGRVAVPLPMRDRDAPRDGDGCCGKACHAGDSRKKKRQKASDPCC